MQSCTSKKKQLKHRTLLDARLLGRTCGSIWDVCSVCLGLMVVQFRRRNDTAHNHVIIPIDDAYKVSAMASSTSRLVCFLATLVAFLMGVGVGVTLPMALARQPAALTELPLALRSSSSSSFSSPFPVQAWVTPKSNDEQNLNIYTEEDLSSGTLTDESVIFLNSTIIDLIPKGFSDQEVEEWRSFARGEEVIRLEEGCGRMQNRLLTFSNGSQSCCRYRQNFDQIQGEIFSFYLSRLLGITNVPPSTLAVVKTGSKQWAQVGNQLALAQWNEERPVVLTKFVDDLQSSYIPLSLRSTSKRSLHPMDIETHDQKSLVEKAQWSDLIIFDYLTANLDRVVNNLYNMQWNPSMMEAPAHNLAQHKTSGLLVFLDNESGLLHGYRLLDKYESLHASLLQSLCVFNRRTAERVTQLALQGDIGEKLNAMFQKHEPALLQFLPTIPQKSVKILNERLLTVHKQIQKCRSMYS